MSLITSLLDTDLYKFTMQQLAFHRFPTSRARYAFHCRTPGADLAALLPRLNKALDDFCALRFSDAELSYLSSLDLFAPDYLQYLRAYQPDRSQIRAEASDRAGEIRIEIDGPWVSSILFEVPVLSMVNELFFSGVATPDTLREGERRLSTKIAQFQKAPADFQLSEFGTRRRFSRAWQRHVVSELALHLPAQFAGTSNVQLAMEFGLRPIGTMAHEYLQAFQRLSSSLPHFQVEALQAWQQEYGSKLGIALTDVVGVDAFLRDFTLPLARSFSGVRHDSGDPFEWGEKVLAHYQRLGVDARDKVFVFSDGLTPELSLELYKRFAGRARPFFGIGTNLTNDLGPKALNIVIKMIELNGFPVAKISDSPGKQMCKDDQYLSELSELFISAPARASRSLS